MKKKLAAFLMAVCMAVPSIGTVGTTVEAADKEEAKVIDVTQYGADPTGVTDSIPAIKKAIEVAKKITKTSDTPVVINFPEGRYDIYPDQAEERELYISNTVGTNQTYKDKKIGILIENMDNVRVEGKDSLFMFHGKMTTFASVCSENVTFQNFEVDFQVPTAIDMTAVKKEGSEVTYYIPEKKLNVEFASEDKNTKVDTVFNDKTVKDNKVTLKPGSNILNIVAAPETSAEPTRYAVNIKDPDSTNANRESVVFSDNVKSDKKFEKTTTEYTGIATSFTTTIDVEAEEKDAMVKVTVNGKEQKELKKVKLVEGDNTIVIEVTSSDKKEKKAYTFKLEGKSVIYLSDLDWKSNLSSGWGELTKDQTYEGNPIRLIEDENGTTRTFEKGIWSHADANIYYDLAGKGYQVLETYVGVDAVQKDSPAAVTFKIFIDGKEVASTEEMTGRDVIQYIKVNIPEDAAVFMRKRREGRS